MIEDHKLRLLSVSAEQQAAQGFKSKIKAECDSFAEDINKIDTDENFESDETLEQQRKELSEKFIFSWRKLKWFREWIAECESKKKKSRCVTITHAGS